LSYSLLNNGQSKKLNQHIHINKNKINNNNNQIKSLIKSHKSNLTPNIIMDYNLFIQNHHENLLSILKEEILFSFIIKKLKNNSSKYLKVNKPKVES